MKHPVVSFLFWFSLIGIHPLLAQDTFLKKIDSLNQTLDRQSGASRVSSLIALSEAYRLVSYDKAMRSGLEALEYADSHQMGRMKAVVLRSIGMSAQNAGDFDLAMRYYHQSLKLLQQIGEPVFAARLHNQIGELKSQLSEYDSALYYFDKVIEASEILNNDSLLAYATNNSGNVWFETGDLNKAHDAFYKAAIMFGAFGDSASQALAEINLSQVLWQWNENDKALDYLEKTIGFARRNQLDDMLSKACSNIGLIFFFDKQEYARALTYFQEALRIREEKGHPVPIANTLVNIANVDIAEGRTNQAISTLRRAMQIYQNAKVVNGQVRVLYHLGEAYQSIKDFRQSNAFFEQCATKALENQIAGYSANVRDQLMENYIAMNDFQSFLRLYGQYKSENDSLTEAHLQLKASEAACKLQNEELINQNEKLKVENTKQAYRLRVYHYLAGSAIGLGLFGLIVFMLWKKNRPKLSRNTNG